MRGLGGVAGDWLERNSGRIGAVASLVGLAGTAATAIGAAAALIRDHPFLALGLVVVALVLFALAWPRLRRRVWRSATETRLALAQQQDRSRLIDAIYVWRVEQSLDASLRRVVPLQVGLQRDPRLVQAEFGTDSTPPGVKRSVQEAFELAQGRLLITGEPGSGKTTLALELLSHLLEQARTDPNAGVPELFPLASWGRRPGPLVEWLEDELRQRGFGPRWICEGRLIPILDGLDEVDEGHRADCLEAINEFRDSYYERLLVVTCRLTEYLRLVAGRPALAFGAGYVAQPLPPAQIIEYLTAAARTNPAWGQVREAVARGDAEELCRLWCTPLMLSMTVLAYAEGDPCELLTVGSPTERVWDVYVEAMRTRSLDPRNRELISPEATSVGGVKPLYTSAEVRRWLGWLASAPAQRGEIWLHRLEPPPVWLFSPRRAQALASGVVYGLLLGFALLLPSLRRAGQWQVQWLWLWLYLVVSLYFLTVFGLVFGLAGSLISGLSYVSESRSRSRGLALGLVYCLVYWVAFALAVGFPRLITSGVPGGMEVAIGVPPAVVFGLAVGIAGGLDENPSYLSGWSVARLGRSLGVGLLVGPIVIGLPFVLTFWLQHVKQAGSWFVVPPTGTGIFLLLGYGLVLGMVGGLFYGVISVGPPRDRPVHQSTHWLIESAKSGVLLALAGGFIVGLLYALAARHVDWTGLLDLALVFVPFFGLAGGLAAVLWHVVLRVWCWRRGLLPLRLVTFLDWSADHLYVQRVGGAYRWVHPTFVDYLAKSSGSRALEQSRAKPPHDATVPQS